LRRIAVALGVTWKKGAVKVREMEVRKGKGKKRN